MDNLLKIIIILGIFSVGFLLGVVLQYRKIPSRIKWGFLNILLRLMRRNRFNYSACVDSSKTEVFGEPVKAFDAKKAVYTGSTKPEKSWMSEKEFLSYRYYGHYKEISDFLISDAAKSAALRLRSDFWSDNFDSKISFLKKSLGVKDLPVAGIIKERNFVTGKSGVEIEKLSLASRIPEISVPLYAARPHKKARGVVIALHGTASTPEKVMGLEPKDYSRNFGLELAKNGFAVYAPFILNLQDKAANISGLGMLYTGNTHWSIELQKLLSVVDCIKANQDLADLPLIVYGISLGGILALMLAAIDKRIDIVVSSAALSRSPNSFDYDINKEINKINYAILNNLNQIVYFQHSDYARLIYPRPLIIELGALDNPIGEIELWKEIKDIYAQKDDVKNLKLVWFKGFHETVPELTIPAIDSFISKAENRKG